MKGLAKISPALKVWIGTYIFFLISLAANFSASHDSIHYLVGIVNGTDLFHQHHLLYHFFAHYWLIFTQKIFTGIPDFYLVEAFTAIWGSAGLAIVYLFFRNRFYLRESISLLGTSVVAFSYGVWFYSVNIEVYSPPMFFILGALYVLTKKSFTHTDAWKVAIFHCLAVLFHQVNILFAVVVLYTFWRRRSSLNIPRVLLQYFMTGIVVVGGLYFFIGWFIEGQNSLTKWTGWMEGYAVGHDYWRPLSFKTPLNVMVGITHAFVGGHYIFQLPGIKNYFERFFQSHSLNDEIFVSANISSAGAWILTILGAIFFIILVILIIRFISSYKAITVHAGNIIPPLIVCIAVYSLFFCFWMPEILEFWILQMVLIWILLVGTITIAGFPFRLTPVAGLSIISLLLFLVNFFGSVRWLRDIKNDWYFSRVERIRTVATPQDAILVQDEWILKDFLSYYTKARVRAIPGPGNSRSGVDSAINQVLTAKGKLYIYPDIGNINKESNTRYIDSLLSLYNARKFLFNKKDPAIWVIQ